MLSEEQRKAIEEEEELRHEVRKRLETANPPPQPAPPAPPAHHGFGKRVFDFLNSSVGMWLLSSVVLTGGAALLQNIQHSHEIEMKNREQLAQHRFEITHRLDQMEYTLRRAKTVGEAKAALDGMYKSKFPLTPELQNRSLGSLFLTVYQLTPGTEQQKTEQAMTFIRRLEDSELALQAHPKDDAPLDEKQKVHLHKLLKSIKAMHQPLATEGKPEAGS
ncbi:MAG: hypothetical protein ISP49_05685 [Reyranella sp.]|nr:hypothetical protein [Reyranella sp.]MBL6651062.1 hypothetical protein [Reyranella sp.]